jgi:hypothetical protein
MALLGGARAVFTMGLQVIAAIGVVIAVGIAVLAAVLFWAVRVSSQVVPVQPPATAPAPAVALLPGGQPVQVVCTGGGCFACSLADQGSLPREFLK